MGCVGSGITIVNSPIAGCLHTIARAQGEERRETFSSAACPTAWYTCRRLWGVPYLASFVSIGFSVGASIDAHEPMEGMRREQLQLGDWGIGNERYYLSSSRVLGCLDPWGKGEGKLGGRGGVCVGRVYRVNARGRFVAAL